MRFFFLCVDFLPCVFLPPTEFSGLASKRANRFSFCFFRLHAAFWSLLRFLFLFSARFWALVSVVVIFICLRCFLSVSRDHLLVSEAAPPSSCLPALQFFLAFFFYFQSSWLFCFLRACASRADCFAIRDWSAIRQLLNNLTIACRHTLSMRKKRSFGNRFLFSNCRGPRRIHIGHVLLDPTSRPNLLKKKEKVKILCT